MILLLMVRMRCGQNFITEILQQRDERDIDIETFYGDIDKREKYLDINDEYYYFLTKYKFDGTLTSYYDM